MEQTESSLFHYSEERFIMKMLLFRLDPIVIPTSLWKRVINAAHSMGHLGITKTKQVLRARY